MKLSYGLNLIFVASLLAACEQLGFEDPAAEKAREEAEGKAIGSGCRQTGRALEDCYQINRRSPKAAIFAGWREMDGYMRENKIEEIKPDFPMKPPPGKGRPLESAEETSETGQQKQTKEGEVAPARQAKDGEPAAAKPALKAEPTEAAQARKSRSPIAR